MEEPLFNAGAAIYDSFTFLRGPAELTAEKARLSPGQKVLDAACGSGWAAMKAAGMVGETGQVTGIDIADKLLDIARQKAADSGLTNIEYLSGDVHTLEFADNGFDAVICASSLFLFGDTRKALGECYRVLKTGSTMVFSTFGRGVFQPVMKLIDDRLREFGEKTPTSSAILVTDSPEKCREIFIGAGFDNADISEDTLAVVYPDKEECRRQICNSLIVRPRINRLDSADKERLKKEILSVLDGFGTSHGITVDVPVIFSSVEKL